MFNLLSDSCRIYFVASEESNLILVSSNGLANQLVKTFTDSSALRTIPSSEPIQSAGSTRIVKRGGQVSKIAFI